MRRIALALVVMLLPILLIGVPAPAAQLSLVMPLGRVAYQTNETIDLSVVREGFWCGSEGRLPRKISRILLPLLKTGV